MTDDLPDGIYARIPLNDLTLAEAVGQVEDPSFWHDTRIAILAHFSQIRIDEYWDLTVGDHRALCDWLIDRGVLSG